MNPPQRQASAQRKRRLLLIAPSFHDYEHRIVEAAEEAGYECLLVDERIGNGFLDKVLTRLRIAQRIKPVMERYLDGLIEKAAEFDPDLVLVINAETLTAPSVARFRAAVPRARFLIYMWDSSSKKRIPQEMYALFDWAGSFDPVDCDNIPGLHHLPLFHLNRSPGWIDENSQPGRFEHDCTFIGTARVRRMVILAAVARRLKAQGKRFHFYLYAPSLGHYAAFLLVKLATGYKGTLSRKSVPYETYQTIIARSASCIDVEQSNQNGLTMRTLEVVFSGRPLITTNRWASRYDFYREFPVSIFEPGGEVEVPAGKPSQSAEALFEKYALPSWLTAILEERDLSYFAGAGR